MIEKVVRRRSLHDRSTEREDLEYWLSRPPGERIEAVEIMRREFHGDLPRIQKVVRVVRLKGTENPPTEGDPGTDEAR
jgi:hypothetical protein